MRNIVGFQMALLLRGIKCLARANVVKQAPQPVMGGGEGFADGHGHMGETRILGREIPGGRRVAAALTYFQRQVCQQDDIIRSTDEHMNPRHQAADGAGRQFPGSSAGLPLP